MSRPLVVLGATGSIGSQTLDVATRLGLSVRALAAFRPSPALAELAAQWPEATIVVAAGTPDERAEFSATVGARASYGPDAVVAVAAEPDAIVVNGIVGAAGLPASVAALTAGNRLALANKESLVAGGDVVKVAADRGGGELIPVDSEHSAMFQCLTGEDRKAIRRLIITASGGPFFGHRREDLAAVTPAQALAHPTWDMGRRISIDSATLLNKGLEVIEAHHLFDVPYDDLEVLVHPGSIVHSLVEFVDGSMKAHLGEPDMRGAIQYAITYPHRSPLTVAPLDLAGRALEFHVPDRSVFPALDLAYAAGRAGGSAPAALNAADEVAVQAFLDGRIGFLDIPGVIEQVLSVMEHRPVTTVDEVLAADAAAREIAVGTISATC